MGGLRVGPWCLSCRHCRYWEYDDWMETLYVSCKLGAPEYPNPHEKCECYEEAPR